MPTSLPRTAAALAFGLLAGTATAQARATTAIATDTTLVIVRVPKPWYAPRALIKSKMLDTRAQYAALDGLLVKAYSFEQTSGDFGGVYQWRDRAAAEAWFNPGWFERVRRERGVEGQVRFFDALLTLDNTPGGLASDDASTSAVTLVEIPVPAGVTRDRLRQGFAAAVPEYQQAPGLLRKHFTVSQDGQRFGGIYLWRDEAAARAWFNEAWHARVIKTYGQDGMIEWFDTPILLKTAAR